MTMIRENEVEKWDSETLGKRLVELNEMALDAVSEAESLELKAKSCVVTLVDTKRKRRIL